MIGSLGEGYRNREGPKGPRTGAQKRGPKEGVQKRPGQRGIRITLTLHHALCIAPHSEVIDVSFDQWVHKNIIATVLPLVISIQ